MKHGRPTNPGNDFALRDHWEVRALRGWRRQHTQCVWNVAMAVLAVACQYEIGYNDAPPFFPGVPDWYALGLPGPRKPQ